jgi:hypothetical protein
MEPTFLTCRWGLVNMNPSTPSALMEHAGGGVFSRAERLEDVLYGACKPPEPAADVSDE